MKSATIQNDRRIVEQFIAVGSSAPESSTLTSTSWEVLAGNVDRLKDSFNLLLDEILGKEDSFAKAPLTLHGTPVLTKEHRQTWKGLSSSLEPAMRVQDRAKALAFILQRCTPVLRYMREGAGQPKNYQMELLMKIRMVLLHVCKAAMSSLTDHSGYTPLHSQCFQYYWESAMALYIFANTSRCVLEDKALGELIRNKLHRLMHEAGACLLRCWSMIRSQDGSLELSPALREDYKDLVKAAVANPDRQRLYDIAVDAMQILTEYICRLALNLLTGMGKNVKLKVNKAEADRLLDDCKALLEEAQGKGALADGLPEVLKLARDGYNTANPGAGKKVEADAFLEEGPATLPLILDMARIADKYLDPERNKLFGPKWLFDMYRCSQLDQTQFLDAASHLVFSAAPGIYATHRLLDWSAYLHTGVEVTWTPEFFYRELNVRLPYYSGPERPIVGADKEPAGQSKESTGQGKEHAEQSKKHAGQSKSSNKGAKQKGKRKG